MKTAPNSKIKNAGKLKTREREICSSRKQLNEQ